jgi:ATP-binding cassette subfamily C (CFTR/MRP) protein 1
LKKIETVRDRELANLKQIGYLSAAQSFTWACTPFLVSFFTFAIYSFTSDEPLTSSKSEHFDFFINISLYALSLFNLLEFPLAYIPIVISYMMSTSVTFNRLFKFLSNEELDKEAVTFELATIGTEKSERIEIRNGGFTWSKAGMNQDTSRLSDINLTVNDGQLLTVVGGVGSGKSSIISCVLGEMYKQTGSVVVRGTLSYVSQSAWIMNQTVRENILVCAFLMIVWQALRQEVLRRSHRSVWPEA